MKIEYNKSLLELNTFHIDEIAAEFAVIRDEKELIEMLTFANEHKKKLKILGGGSNILLTKKADHLVLLNKLKGIRTVNETNEYADIQFMSGENWHECVLSSVAKNLGGIENLSLIPGSIGAAPIQNIGAYGAELKDVFIELSAIDTETHEKRTFQIGDCAFGYRDSVFKRTENSNYFIVSVTLRLQKNPAFNIEYGDIKKILVEDFNNDISIKNISDAVIKIRTSKLPDPDKIGNAGSFFKNPVVHKNHADELKKIHLSMPSFEVENGVKIPAAWLIEQCHWKGFRAGKYGVHAKQALVLVNYGDAKGADILTLSNDIITSVQQRFNIRLEREVNIW